MVVCDSLPSAWFVEHASVDGGRVKNDDIRVTLILLVTCIARPLNFFTGFFSIARGKPRVCRRELQQMGIGSKQPLQR